MSRLARRTGRGERETAERALTLTNGTLSFRYELKNGKTVERSYDLTTKEIRGKAYRLCCEPESMVYRMSRLRDNTDELELGLYDEEGKVAERITLNDAQTADLFERGVLPDAREGRIARPEKAEAWASTSRSDAVKNGRLRYVLNFTVKESDEWAYRYNSIYVFEDSRNTIRWIEDYLARNGAAAIDEL